MNATAALERNVSLTSPRRQALIAQEKCWMKDTFLEYYRLTKRGLSYFGRSHITTKAEAAHHSINYLFRKYSLSRDLTAKEICLMGQEIAELFQVSRESFFLSRFEKLWSKWLFVFEYTQ